MSDDFDDVIESTLQEVKYAMSPIILSSLKLDGLYEVMILKLSSNIFYLFFLSVNIGNIWDIDSVSLTLTQKNKSNLPFHQHHHTNHAGLGEEEQGWGIERSV